MLRPASRQLSDKLIMAEQRINHDRRRSLAVSTGNLDDGTGLLWVTEQVEDGSLPIQTGADAMLRPASRQLSDKLIMAAQ